MEATRKRSRSNENVLRQQKYFITNQIMEKNDAVLMEEIYKKTLNMMFAGAKRNQTKEALKHNKSLEYNNNDDIDEKITDIVEDKLPDSIRCDFCSNYSPSAHKICSNCNLKVCLERCTLENCVYCEKVLCGNCINIFGCSIESEDGIITAVCEDCKNLLE